MSEAVQANTKFDATLRQEPLQVPQHQTNLVLSF